MMTLIVFRHVIFDWLDTSRAFGSDDTGEKVGKLKEPDLPDLPR